jgi:Holliday junction DNA helicase RuvA
MITRITGTLFEKQPPFLAVDVNGLTYELQASMNTFYHLPETGSNVTLLTHFIVREDAHILYGFWDKRERALFQTLLKVNGIGPKSALAILSSIAPDNFVRCVEDKNTLALQRLPGIGKKTAERLIVEMRDRLEDWNFGAEAIANLLNKSTDVTPNSRSAELDAISALVALGYKPQEASRAINQITETGLSSQEMIRQALKNITGA